MKHKAINIRGANGSGKSFLVKSFMNKFSYEPIREAPLASDLLDIGGIIEANEVKYRGRSVFVIGPYPDNKVNVGCDYLSKRNVVDPFKAIEQLVEKYHSKDHVIFEGIMIASSFARWYEVSKRIGGTIWVYLDTPLDLCLQRILQRNKGKQIKPHVARKYFDILTTAEKAILAGETVILMDHTKALDGLCQLLNQRKPTTNVTVEEIQNIKKRNR